MKPMKVHYDHLLRNGDTGLYTRSPHLVVHSGVAGIGASVIRHLKVAVPGGAHFGQDRFILLSLLSKTAFGGRPFGQGKQPGGLTLVA